MEKKPFLESGKIVNTHGVRGEVKIQPWCDSPAFLQQFKTLYIGSEPYHVHASRVHKDCLIVKLDGVDDINQAMALKNRVVFIARSEAKLPEGSWFIQDILGLPVFDEALGEIGTLAEVLDMPSGSIYVVRSADGTEHLIPGVPAFIRKIDPEAGRITVAMIEGM